MELRIRQINGMTIPKPVMTACNNRSKVMKTGLFTALKLVNYFELMPIKRLLSLINILGKA